MIFTIVHLRTVKYANATQTKEKRPGARISWMNGLRMKIATVTGVRRQEEPCETHTPRDEIRDYRN